MGGRGRRPGSVAVVADEQVHGGDVVARTRTPRLVATALVVAEAVVLVGLALFLVVELFVAEAAEPGGAVGLAALTLVGGLGLLLCARGIHAGRRWSRAPTLTWQLLQLSVAVPLAGSERWYLGIPAVLAALAVAGLMLSGRTLTEPPPTAR